MQEQNKPVNNPAVEEKKQRSLWQEAWRRFRKNRMAMIGLAFILLLVIISISTLVIDAATHNSIFISRTTAGDHDLAYFGWTTSSGDADYSYYSLEHSTQQGAAGNRSFLADPDVDKLIEEARSNTNEEERKELYKELAIKLDEINNNIPVYYSSINVGANKKVEGFVMDANGYHSLEKVKVAQ